MTTNLQQNRYGCVVPTHINSLGTSISTPFYISPSFEARKALLNAFRQIKTKQLIEMGYSQERKEGQLTVIDSSTAPMTPIEADLGQNEESLRMILFAKGGIQDRILLKVQAMVGIEVVTKEEVSNTYKAWLDHVFTTEKDEHQDTLPTPKATRKSTKTKKTATSSTTK